MSFIRRVVTVIHMKTSVEMIVPHVSKLSSNASACDNDNNNNNNNGNSTRTIVVIVVVVVVVQ